MSRCIKVRWIGLVLTVDAETSVISLRLKREEVRRRRRSSEWNRHVEGKRLRRRDDYALIYLSYQAKKQDTI